MANKANYQANTEKSADGNLIQVPVRINPETEEEFRRNHPDVHLRMWKIGGRRYLCAVYLLPKDHADDFLRMQQTEAKREQREERCLIPDSSGGFIRCPERNKCIGCERVRDFDFDSLLPASLDALREGSDFDVEAPTLAEDNEDAANEMMTALIQRLGEMKPRYADIFREMLGGDDSPLHISKKLNLRKSQTYTDVAQVRKLARDLYFELLGE